MSHRNELPDGKYKVIESVMIIEKSAKVQAVWRQTVEDEHGQRWYLYSANVSLVAEKIV